MDGENKMTVRRRAFLGIVAAGNDVVTRGSKRCGSVLIDRMTVAGD